MVTESILTEGSLLLLMEELESPCVTCEFRNRVKTKCTNIKNYCRELLRFQNKLDKLDHSIIDTQYDSEIPISFGSRVRSRRYDFD